LSDWIVAVVVKRLCFFPFSSSLINRIWARLGVDEIFLFVCYLFHFLIGVRLLTVVLAFGYTGERRGWWAVAPVQYTLMCGLCITYAVTAGQSLKGVASADCSGADCQDGIAPWIILFGILQLFLSQVPDFHSLWWVSLLGGVMSIGYCAIAAGASIAAAVSGEDQIETRSNESTADKVFGVLNALGGVAFTFGGQAVLPEIQATLGRPPRSPQSMMKGIGVAYVVVITTYFSVAISGYAAYGTNVEPDVLLSISRPQALVDVADIMVVLHVAAGYQVFAMPMFDVFERTVLKKLRRPPRPIVLRLFVRSLFVIVTTLIAVMLPFFGDLMVRHGDVIALFELRLYISRCAVRKQYRKGYSKERIKQNVYVSVSTGTDCKHRAHANNIYTA